jgi:hypothetical protein
MTMKTLFTVLVCFIGACEAPIAQHEIPGIYQLRVRGATDTLTLTRDGLFHHKYVADQGAAIIDEEGLWAWKEKASRRAPDIAIHGYTAVVPEFERLDVWVTPVLRRRGMVCIVVFEDLGLYYAKISDAP